MEIANVPSISLGVIHEGTVFFQKSFGLRDVDANLEANSDTSYLISACSNMFTATLVGILVREGKIAWKNPIRKYLPSFNPIDNPRVGEEATIADLCTHSTGIANILFQGPGGAIIHRAEDHIALVNALPTCDHDGPRFPGWYKYSSGAFGLLALVIEAASKMTYSAFLRQRILEPLGLTQTLVSEADVETNDNLAHPYTRMTDGEWRKINNHITTENHSPFLASVGIRSSINDILAFLAAVMNCYDTEQGLEDTQPLLDEVKENPLREIGSMLNKWWIMQKKDEFDHDIAGALGWYCRTIPTGALDSGSYNSFKDDFEDSAVKLKDILGRDSEPRTLYGHYGISNGSLATTYCFPSSHTAIVVLGNAAEAGDAPTTIAQILLQAIFDLKPHIDLLPLLRQQRQRCLKEHDDVIRAWKGDRDVSKYTGSAKDFIGSYLGLNTCRISITASDTAEAKVAVVFNDNDSSKCDLEPYNEDSLSFMVAEHDKLLAKSMIDWDYYKVGILEFFRENGVVKGFRWQWDQMDRPALWVKTEDGVDNEEIKQILKSFDCLRI